MRLTKRNKNGRAVLNKEAFPEYSQETLWIETQNFEPTQTVIEKLCQLEETIGKMSRGNLQKNK